MATPARNLFFAVAVAAMFLGIRPMNVMSHHQPGHYGGPKPRWAGVSQPASAPAGLSDQDNSDYAGENDYITTYTIDMDDDVTITVNTISDLEHETTSEALDTFWSFSTDGNGVSSTGIPSGTYPTQGQDTFVSTAAFISAGVVITHAGGDGTVLLTVTSRGLNPDPTDPDGCEIVQPTTGNYSAFLNLEMTAN